MQDSGITEISIKNIKGFGEPAQIIKLDNNKGNGIKSKKVNLLVAPNGWGKSSLTVAFESLRKNKLDVPSEMKYHQDGSLDSELSITLDNVKYTANKSKNEIYGTLHTRVIHCDTYAGTINKNMGNFTTSKGYIGIKSIEVCKRYTLKKLQYNITDEKKAFGKNSKLLCNLKDKLSNREFIELFDDFVFDNCKKLSTKKVKDIFTNIQNEINSKNGTENEIRSSIDDNIFNEINQNENYANLKKKFCAEDTELDAFTGILQILSIVSKNSKTDIKQIQKYHKYTSFKQKLNKHIKNINSTWKDIECREDQEKLYVDFPNADLISNGQRDILTFTIHLQAFKSEIQSGKKYLLIIDEVFDYLDDANTLAVQYYLSDLLTYAKNNKIELFLVLLSHLTPNNFRSYIFNKNLLNICYLKDIEAKAKHSIAFRQSLNREKEPDKSLWNKLSKYYFHYHKNSVNLIQEILPYKTGEWKNLLNENLYDGNKLFEYLVDELNKYLSGNTKYDPYAVSLAIRIGTEKKVYEQLENEEDKEFFIDRCNDGTKHKLDFAQKKGIIIPDTYYILCLIHGETNHTNHDNDNVQIEFDKHQMKFNEKPVVYKLDHPVIKHMIAELFDYKENIPVPLSKIH